MTKMAAMSTYGKVNRKATIRDKCNQIPYPTFKSKWNEEPTQIVAIVNNLSFSIISILFEIL